MADVLGILSRNGKTPLSEIDTIAEDGDPLVLVEVKTRTHASCGLPFETVGRRKREKLSKVVLYHLLHYLQKDARSFHILSTLSGQDKNDIEHIADAFQQLPSRN